MENVKAMKKANIACLSAMELTDSSIFDGSVFCGGTAVDLLSSTAGMLLFCPVFAMCMCIFVSRAFLIRRR